MSLLTIISKNLFFFYLQRQDCIQVFQKPGSKWHSRRERIDRIIWNLPVVVDTGTNLFVQGALDPYRDFDTCIFIVDNLHKAQERGVKCCVIRVPKGHGCYPHPFSLRASSF